MQKSETAERLVRTPRFLDRTWIETCGLVEKNHNSKTILDLSETEKIDSAGIAFLNLLQKLHKEAHGELILRNVAPHIVPELKYAPLSTEKEQKNSLNDYFVNVGEQTINIYKHGLRALSVFVEMLYWGSIGLLHRRDFRKGSLGEEMYQLGFKAIMIVSLLSFLVGIVLSIQSAIQLLKYGAGVFLASIIGRTFIRELGPLLTAVILAGRTGSATTAEIATMGVGEELDALHTMGINPIQFVVVPKLWAISLTMPLLSGLATAAGILGGFLVALMYLDITPSLYWAEFVKHLYFRDVFAGFFKSLIFSWLIIWIGSYYGFKVKGGAEAVGKETTASVVTCIFVIILINAAFSFIL